MTKTPPTIKAACYLRSSKDRSDVSIDVQRRALDKLAAERGLVIIREFADTVLSGKDDNRPAFLELLRELRKRSRPWSVILLLDPERLARNRYVATAFEQDCETANVRVLFASLPESNPVVDMILKPVMHGMAHYFSWQSKMKGLAGLAENVRQGWRAGGRAPMGYQLEHVATGAIREGQPVTKSRLTPTDDAPGIGAYLKARASGISRATASMHLSRPVADTSLIGMEWNALTYAGHTVWNVHNEYHGPRLGVAGSRGGYKGGVKRRPRDEWQIQRSTHAALITDDEAETIIARLEASPYKRTRRTTAAYLLTGLLKTPDGTPWYGDANNNRRFYRIGRKGAGAGRSVAIDAVDKTVLGCVSRDLQSPKFVAAAYASTLKHLARDSSAEITELKARDAALVARISRFMDMAGELHSPGPVVRKIDEIEKDRAAIAARIEELQEQDRQAAAMTKITERDVGRLLADMAAEIKTYDREQIKDWLAAILDRVELDPQRMSCELHYRIPLSQRNRVASPGQSPSIPLIYKTRAKVA